MLNIRFSTNQFNQQGFSLIELLIAMLLGLALMSMIIGLYVTNVSTGVKSLKFSRLRTDLQSILSMLEDDIRRAGYGGSSYLVGNSADKTIDINEDQNCIVYYYNHNKTSAVESENKMAFSFRDNAIKFKSGVGRIAEEVCDGNTSGWTSISDEQFITITALSLTETVTSNAAATMRSVKIDLAGKLTSDDNYTHSLSSRVQVRNIEFND